MGGGLVKVVHSAEKKLYPRRAWSLVSISTGLFQMIEEVVIQCSQAWLIDLFRIEGTIGFRMQVFVSPKCQIEWLIGGEQKGVQPCVRGLRSWHSYS